METPKLNNQSKVDLEKTPQENEESLGTQEQESGKRENITLEIDGQKIEVIKYYFEYPEQIQKETGILGYERVKISKENLGDLKEFDKHKGSKIVELLSFLSDKQYPNECVTHRMSAFADKAHKNKHTEDFVKDKFFIQKIYDMDRMDKIRSSGLVPKSIFNYRGDYLNFFSKENNSPQDLLNQNDFNIGEVSKELLQEKKTFLIKAFNVAPSDFWQNDISSEDIGFGFSISNDPLFKEYLKLSSINLLCLDPEKKLAKDTFALYLVSLYKSLEYKSGDAVNNKDTTYMARSEFVSKIDKITKKFIEDNNIDLKENTDLDMQKYTIHRLLDGLGLDFFIETGMMNSSVSETDIPIYINHDKIPQLSWGHAKYAHYFNDKSFNFFKFKHADHLPVKEEVNSSES